MDNSDLYFSLKDRNIVIVEDSETTFRYFNSVLKNTGANIVWLKNGQEAINYCTNLSNKIDLIIMDVFLPVITGIDATRKIKLLRKNLPVISISANDSMEIQEKSFLSGCDKFLYKPLLPKQLLDSIKYFLKNDQDPSGLPKAE